MLAPTPPTTNRDVRMGEFVIDDAVDALTTEGLGPCVAIGIRHEGWLALLHQFGPSQGAPEFGHFFQELEKLIPAHARRSVHPVVAGAKLDFEHDGEDAAVNSVTLEDRAWVLRELARIGFGAPQVCWGITDAKSQAVRLERGTSSAKVTTEAWDGALSSKSVPLPPA